ncbi:MAG: hypothetical protein WC869_03070 [Phycisphaerae bacterium]|jgi:2-phosphoglycerate kinase
MNVPRVILVGGAPLSGKTAVACRLAARLGYACLSTDDLGTAITAVTSSQSHPALHPMAGQAFAEYYSQRDDEELRSDALRQLKATWPAAAAVIHAHATWRCPAVIEGWALLPEYLAELKPGAIAPVYLASDEQTFRRRLEEDEDFRRAASSHPKLIERFCQRSAWYNRMVIDSARRLGLPLVESLSTNSLDEVTGACLRAIQSE